MAAKAGGTEAKAQIVDNLVSGEKEEAIHDALRTDKAAAFVFVIREILAAIEKAQKERRQPDQRRANAWLHAVKTLPDALELLKLHPNVRIANPLHSAAANNSVKTIAEIMQIGCDVNTLRSGDGMTSLAAAAQSGAANAVALLLEHQADTDIADVAGLLPIHHAAAGGDAGCVSAILNAGSSVHVTSASEETPLHFACAYGSRRAAALLLDRGADINVKSKRGYSALHYAVEGGHGDVVDELIDRGCKVQITEKQNNITEVASDAYAQVPYMMAVAKLKTSSRASLLQMSIVPGGTVFDAP
mmetsp:Transcript_16735/g.43421  ORF Transcript_16735/g.43421 Transcript_16735/m.43421 type:complete len:302 (+) Transcript_16735:107-1012(+)